VHRGHFEALIAILEDDHAIADIGDVPFKSRYRLEQSHDDIQAAIASVEGVNDVHDLHVWSIGSESHALSCHIAIALGTMFGGWRIVRTMGNKLTRLQPMGGVCAESSAAATLFFASFKGIPVSTTHTITGAIVGVGSANRMSAVNWNVASRVVWAWVFTIPGAASVAMVSYWFVETLSR